MELEPIANLVGSGAVAFVAWRIIPLLRVLVRLGLDTRTRVRALERALAPTDKDPTDARDQPDELDATARAHLGAGP